MRKNRAITAIEKCIKAQRDSLDLSNCGLRDRDFNPGREVDIALRNCTHLKILILSNPGASGDQPDRTILTRLPPAIHDLTSLTHLMCRGSQYTTGDLQYCDSMYNLRNLITLDLSYNILEDIESLDQLVSLQKLILGGNCLEQITPFYSLPSLLHLDLNYNGISRITNLDRLPSLRILNLSGNNITETEGLDKLFNL
jgi:Leucine-rich repeat (LRR) protein